MEERFLDNVLNNYYQDAYQEDIRLTKSLVEIGKLQGITITDHLIIGDDKYYSFYNERKDMFT